MNAWGVILVALISFCAGFWCAALMASIRRDEDDMDNDKRYR
jgi:hypothetical protein